MNTTNKSSWLAAARAVVQHQSATLVNPATGAYEALPDEVFQCEMCEQPRTREDGPCGYCGRLPYDGPGVLLDLFTASMLTQVYDALGETNRVHFESMDLRVAVNIGWKAISKR